MPDIIGAVGRMRGRRAVDDDRGAAALEFALVSIPLITLLFGILQYGFFFFQLTSAQSVVASAARQVEVGAITDCDIWEADARRLMALDDTAEISWARTSGDGAIERGDVATVTVDWTPIRIGAGLVPFPGSGQQRQSLEVGIDHIGPVGEIWDATPGCP